MANIRPNSVRIDNKRRQKDDSTGQIDYQFCTTVLWLKRSNYKGFLRFSLVKSLDSGRAISKQCIKRLISLHCTDWFTAILSLVGEQEQFL